MGLDEIVYEIIIEKKKSQQLSPGKLQYLEPGMRVIQKGSTLDVSIKVG